MTFKYRYRKQIVIALIIIITLIGGVGGILFYQTNYKKKEKIEKKEMLVSKKSQTNIKRTTTTDTKEENNKIMVDIKGQVINPGLYSLEEKSRVIDVINMAGGLTEVADTTVINLSKKISDEMVIIIYSKQEVENFKETKEELEKKVENCKNYYEDIQNDACIESDTISNEAKTTNQLMQTETISINTATLEQLQTLPGIGESKAQNIIKYREEHGGFKSIEELKEVNGIGDSIFVKIKENITL